MKPTRDLAVTLITSALLLLAVGYLTQCSAPPQRPSPDVGAAPAHDNEEAEQEKAEGQLRSGRERDENGGQEEREKIQRVGRALQTIGANPEMRKTYGIPH